MKRKALPAFAVLSLFLLSTACTTRLADINRGSFESMTLDADDGRGPQPYEGGELPKSPDRKLKTYRFSIDLDLSGRSSPLSPALVVGPSAFPYELSLNGRLIHRYGEHGDQDRTRMYSSSLIHLPAEALLERNLIEVKAWIGAERSPLMDLGLVDSREGSSYVFWRNFFMSEMVAAGFAIGILLFIYFLFMFLLNMNKSDDRRFLWFALLCGSFSLAYVNVVFNHMAASDTFLTKMGRTGFFISGTMLSFYVMEVTGILARKRWLKRTLLGAIVAGSLWVLVQRGYNATNDAFHLAMQFIITPNLLLSVVLVVIAMIRKGFRPYAILSLGIAGIVAASLYDMAFESRNFIPYAWTLAYGYEWLVVCIFLELAVKQERVSRTALAQAEDLNRKNSILKSVFLHLRAGSDSLAVSTEELAVSTCDISSTGNEQAVAVREIVSTMEDSSQLLNGISQKSSLVHQESRETARKAEEGVASVKTALSKLEAVIGRISESISLITDFNEHLGSITEVVKLIEGIATHIRIIAFNASLEAVAAGDAGRNFRIVAEEVKRLSDSTMASVKSIREKVNSLITMSGNVAEVAQAGYVSLEQSWDIASGMGDSFSEIAEASESSARATADIDTSLKEEANAFDQILLTLKEISSGVNNFVDSAARTSETTRRLNDIAEKLHGIIVQYSGEFSEEGGGAEGKS